LENELPHSDTSGGTAAIAMPQPFTVVFSAAASWPSMNVCGAGHSCKPPWASQIRSLTLLYAHVLFRKHLNEVDLLAVVADAAQWTS
jgi:hypothetical protein